MLEIKTIRVAGINLYRKLDDGLDACLTWILTLGYWQDSKYWRDQCIWKDS